MKWTSVSAIFFLFFAASAFFLLPFGVKTDEEMGTEKVAGQADSAPHRFDLKRHLLKAALLGAALTAILSAGIRRRTGPHCWTSHDRSGARGRLRLCTGRWRRRAPSARRGSRP